MGVSMYYIIAFVIAFSLMASWAFRPQGDKWSKILKFVNENDLELEITFYKGVYSIAIKGDSFYLRSVDHGIDGALKSMERCISNAK